METQTLRYYKLEHRHASTAQKRVHNRRRAHHCMIGKALLNATICSWPFKSAFTACYEG